MVSIYNELNKLHIHRCGIELHPQAKKKKKLTRNVFKTYFICFKKKKLREMRRF